MANTNVGNQNFFIELTTTIQDQGFQESIHFFFHISSNIFNEMPDFVNGSGTGPADDGHTNIGPGGFGPQDLLNDLQAMPQCP